MITNNVTYFIDIVDCKLSTWTTWAWDNSNQSCGKGTRFRSELESPDGQGKSCRTKYNCTTNCFQETTIKLCPGMKRFAIIRIALIG